MRPKKKDCFFPGLGMVGFGLGLFFIVIPIQVYAPESSESMAQSPRFFPNLIAWAFVFLGSVLMFGVELIVGEQEDEKQLTEPDKKWIYSRKLKVILAITLMLLYSYSLEALGFIYASVLALGLLMFIMGRRTIWQLVVLSFLIPYALYFFFNRAANVVFP